MQSSSTFKKSEIIALLTISLVSVPGQNYTRPRMRFTVWICLKTGLLISALLIGIGLMFDAMIKGITKKPTSMTSSKTWKPDSLWLSPSLNLSPSEMRFCRSSKSSCKPVKLWNWFWQQKTTYKSNGFHIKNLSKLRLPLTVSFWWPGFTRTWCKGQFNPVKPMAWEGGI